LQVLRALADRKTTLDKAAAAVALYPQVLLNVAVKKRFDFAADAEVKKALAAADKGLAGSGRVLLRASGTEPVIRVMVEGKVRSKVEGWAKKIAAAVREAAPG
jgi:phosphoglucosamine mutase